MKSHLTILEITTNHKIYVFHKLDSFYLISLDHKNMKVVDGYLKANTIPSK